MEKQSEAAMLQQHGTALCRLPATAILFTAKTDLKRRERNIERGCAGDCGYEHYGFLATHVRFAKDGRDLIKRALAKLDDGQSSGKIKTRYLYCDEDGLRAALSIRER